MNFCRSHSNQICLQHSESVWIHVVYIYINAYEWLDPLCTAEQGKHGKPPGNVNLTPNKQGPNPPKSANAVLLHFWFITPKVLDSSLGVKETCARRIKQHNISAVLDIPNTPARKRRTVVFPTCSCTSFLIHLSFTKVYATVSVLENRLKKHCD